MFCSSIRRSALLQSFPNARQRSLGFRNFSGSSTILKENSKWLNLLGGIIVGSTVYYFTKPTDSIHLQASQTLSTPPSSPSNVSASPTIKSPTPPGSSTSITSKVLGTGATLLQSFAPLDPVCQHICGFHIYSGEPKRQVEAHHYCMHLNEDMRQCLIFDGHQEGARLIGVEYIISRKLFEALPEEEKKYWHSHVYEVKGGVIHMPSRTGVPRAVIRPAEKAEMEKLVDTYGKTFHFWQIDRGDPLPYGPPQLMMALTNSSMDNPTLMKSRDERFKVSLPELRKEREYIPAVEKAKGCDTWEKGQVWQLQLVRK